MATNRVKLESVVIGKPPVDTLSKPQARPSSAPQVRPKSEPIKSEDHRLPGLPWDMTAPEAWENKVYSLEDTLSHLNNAERLTYELERFGQHFTVEEGDRWTQAEVDEEWARLHPPSSSPRSLAFVLNWDFKPASPPKVEYIVLDDNDDAQTPVPSPVQVPAISNSSMPVAKETPVNYWDDWRAREAKEAERLLKKRKSEDDWGKFLF